MASVGIFERLKGWSAGDDRNAALLVYAYLQAAWLASGLPSERLQIALPGFLGYLPAAGQTWAEKARSLRAALAHPPVDSAEPWLCLSIGKEVGKAGRNLHLRIHPKGLACRFDEGLGQSPQLLQWWSQLWTLAPADVHAKLEEISLPLPLPFAIQPAGGALEARTQAEIIFGEILPQKPIWSQGFIENGGDSIKAVQVVARLKKQGWNGSLVQLMQARSLDNWLQDLHNIEEKSSWQMEEGRHSLDGMALALWQASLAGRSHQHYVEQFSYALDFSPEIEDLELVLQSIWADHPQLRVAVKAIDGQLYLEPLDIPLDFQFIEGISAEDLAQAERELGFEPDQALIRLRICKSEEGRWHWIWTHHHLLMDGWSAAILGRETLARWKALEDLGLLFCRPSRNWNAWRQSMAKPLDLDLGDAEALSLMRLPSSQVLGAANYQQPLSPELWNSLQEKANSLHLTAQSLLMGILGMAMGRLSRQEKLWFSVISNGRENLGEEAETAVGLLIRNLPFRFDGAALDAARHFQSLALMPGEWAMPARSDLLFVFENYPYTAIDDRFPMQLQQAHEATDYPLSLLAMPSESGLRMQWISTQAGWNESWLQAAHQYLEKCIAEFLDKSNPLPQPMPAVLDQANAWTAQCWEVWLAHPQNPCLQLGGHTLSAKEVMDFILQFKSCCDANSWTKGDRILIGGQRDPEQWLWVLGCLFNGLSYVPLHPNWPTARILQIAKDCQAKGMLWKAEIPSELAHIPTLDAKIAAPNGSDRLPDFPSEQDEAYVLYTSGSTGQAKGISMRHANVSAMLQDCQWNLQDAEHQSVAALTQISFDLSVFEMLYPLYAGKLGIWVKDPGELEERLAGQEQVLLNTVPSVAQRLDAAAFQNISVLNCAGEPFSLALFEHLLKANPKMRRFNWYGPSETCTYSTCQEIRHANDVEWIGWALRHEAVWIGDNEGKPLPPGMAGEIWIGGAGLANGYLDGSIGGFRNGGYATGDWGLMDARGSIRYLGRMDRQWKHRGFRIEPGEIEQQALEAGCGAKRARAGLSNGKIWLAIEGMDADHASTMMAYLQRQLPSYAIPDQLCLLAAFPENHHGKVDAMALKALVEQSLDDPEASTSTKAALPQAVFEAIWTTLGIQPLQGSHPIKQGADSIGLMRLAAKLRQIGFPAETQHWYANDSWEKWWEALSKLAPNQPKVRFSSESEAILSPIQSWFLEEFEGNRHHYNQAMVFRLPLQLQAQTDIGEVLATTFNGLPAFIDKWYAGSSKTQLQPGKIQRKKWPQGPDLEAAKAIHNQLQASLNLDQGPVWAACLHESPSDLELFICIHHLVVDGIGWRWLMQLLQSGLMGATEKNGALSPEQLNRAYNAAIAHRIEAKSVQYSQLWQEASFSNPWKTLPKGRQSGSTLLEQKWPEQLSSRFTQTLQSAGIGLQPTLLALTAEAWRRLNLPDCQIWLEGHGRNLEEVEGLWESSGWFTAIYPLPAMDLAAKFESSISEMDRVLGHVPDGGSGFMTYWRKILGRPWPDMGLLWNFLGDFDQGSAGLASVSELPAGDGNAQENSLLARLEWNGWLANGQLHTQLRISQGLDSEPISNLLSTMMQLAQDWLNGNFKAHVAAPKVLGSISEADLLAAMDMLGDLED